MKYSKGGRWGGEGGGGVHRDVHKGNIGGKIKYMGTSREGRMELTRLRRGGDTSMIT